MQVGDIILSRGKKSPGLVFDHGISRENWEKAFLFIGDNRILDVSENGSFVRFFDCLLCQDDVFAIFRVIPNLDEAERKQLKRTALSIAGVRWKFWVWIKRHIFGIEDVDIDQKFSSGMSPGKFVSSCFAECDRSIRPALQSEQITPIDISESHIVVRTSLI
jgi:hypothetical protein